MHWKSCDISQIQTKPIINSPNNNNNAEQLAISNHQLTGESHTVEAIVRKESYDMPVVKMADTAVRTHDVTQVTYKDIKI